VRIKGQHVGLAPQVVQRILDMAGWQRADPAQVLGQDQVSHVAVLGVTAVLVSQPPARITYGPAVTLTAPLGADRVTVRVSPTRRGPEPCGIRVLNAAGDPLPATRLTATLSSASVASLAVTLHPAGTSRSHWTSTAAVVPIPGACTLILNTSLGRATAYTTSASYQVW
jgi:copper transport protein